MSFKKEISILSHLAKKKHFKSFSKKNYRPVNICKTAYSSQGCVKNMNF